MQRQATWLRPLRVMGEVMARSGEAEGDRARRWRRGGHGAFKFRATPPRGQSPGSGTDRCEAAPCNAPMALPVEIRSLLALPAVCAPMFLVSGPALVREACKAGLVGGLPRQNARSFAEFGGW